MLLKLIVAIGLLSASSALAQDSKAPPPIRPLSDEDCSKIRRLPDGNLRVEGEVQIGQLNVVNSTIGPNGISLGGVDPYEVVMRSCFRDRRS
jgi:hypothetical protein